MKHLTLKAVLVGAVLVCAASMDFSQTNLQSPFDYGAMPYGPTEYELSCAACHGRTGKGDGPNQASLAHSPPDLTTLAKANKGVFPYHRVYAIIDGRETVPVHGTREMPIWGPYYLEDASGHHLKTPSEQESYARIRISWLIDYLMLLQEK